MYLRWEWYKVVGPPKEGGYGTLPKSDADVSERLKTRGKKNNIRNSEPEDSSNNSNYLILITISFAFERCSLTHITYTDSGQLTCILCSCVVRSEAVWSSHINSKQHKDNIAHVKRQKEQVSKIVTTVPSLGIKRPAVVLPEKPPKKLKGILKNAPSQVPSDFFDNDTAQASKDEKMDTSSHPLVDVAMSDGEESEGGDASAAAANDDETLPEGFFDDPLQDAKARNVEYKDPIQEEWEKFQREMKEEASLSAQIIAEDQEEATAERQIEEIDEQMRNWSRVIDLERKKEQVAAVGTRVGGEDDEGNSSADEAEFEEYLDWRAKKSYK